MSGGAVFVPVNFECKVFAMLQAIRDRAQGIFAWIMLIAIGIPFALWGIQNYLDTGKEKPAAVVGDREIFDREVSMAYEQSLANLVGVADYDEKQVRYQALEKLVLEEVIYQSAEGKSLVVSDADIRAFIQTLPYFQTDGKFDKEKYKVMLAAQNLSPNQFGAQVHRALLMEQFQKGVLESAFVTKDQVQTLLRLKNQEREIEYARIPLKSSDNKVFSDMEIEAYYREHLSDFRNPEQVSVEYIAISLEELAKGVQVTDDDIRNLYEEQKANFSTEERRKVSHILISPETQSAEADTAALAKITQIRERLIRGEDFAKVAAESSSDSLSAKRGGDLGYVDKSGMDESFAKAVYTLTPGEVSEPVKTSFGYHLIKVTELIPSTLKPFDSVKDELRKTAQHNIAENKFYELGQILTEQAYEHPDSLDAAAKRVNLEIMQSGLFTRDSGEGIASEPAIRSAAFGEEVLKGRNSDPVEIGNEKAIVLRLKEHRSASDKPISEVKETIVAKLRDVDARREAAAEVAELLKQTEAGASLAEAAKAWHLEVVKPRTLRRMDDKLPAGLVAAVFKAPRPAEGRARLGTIGLENGEQIVFNLIGVKDGAIPGDDSKEEVSAREFLARAHGQREFASFVARLREIADVQLKPES